MKKGKSRSNTKTEWANYELEPICLFIARCNLEQPDQKEIDKAVKSLMADFRIIRTLNPLVWLFVGRWRPEITDKKKDRLEMLLQKLKSNKGNSSVTPSVTWTNALKQQELAWKAWRDLIA
jgi:hypothetical protein